MAKTATPASLDELVTMLREAMGDGGITDLDEEGLERVKDLMTSYKVGVAAPRVGAGHPGLIGPPSASTAGWGARQSNEADWKKYVNFDPYKYTRNLVDDGNGKFNLIVLCWSEGQARCAGMQRGAPADGGARELTRTVSWRGS